MINGRTYDWESLTVTMPWGISYSIREISYDEEKSITPLIGRGDKPYAYGRGSYKGSGKFTIDLSEYDRIAAFAASFGGILNLPPFPIVLAYANGEQLPRVDVLPQCKITKKGRSIKTGDGEEVVSIDFEMLSPAVENGIPSAK